MAPNKKKQIKKHPVIQSHICLNFKRQNSFEKNYLRDPNQNLTWEGAEVNAGGLEVTSRPAGTVDTAAAKLPRPKKWRQIEDHMGKIADVPWLSCLLFFLLWAADTCFHSDVRHRKENTFAHGRLWYYQGHVGELRRSITVLLQAATFTALLHPTPGVKYCVSVTRTLSLSVISH